MRACAISSPSMAAMKRPKKVEEGVRPKEAVLDIVSPCCGTADRCGLELSRHTKCQEQSICLHSSILSFAMQHNRDPGAGNQPRPNKRKGAAGNRRPLT